jgi:hypothetical protein
MNEPRSNQDQQTIGLYEVFLHGQQVVICSPHLESARLFKPDEALKLLEWLTRHQEDFRKAINTNAVLC